MTDPSDVKGYYEGFADEVLLEDFHRFNLRQDAVRQLCRRFVPRGSKVLEVGCGVGIISRYLRSSLGCRVVGVDISETNIKIAEAYAGSHGCRFEVLDVIEDARKLETMGAFDVILLPDVIEHIPKNRYGDLFTTIQGALGEKGRVLMTFPSPGYQEFLKTNHPEHLQVVDETVELSDITNNSSLEVHYFSHRDVWLIGQYAHVVLATDRAFEPVPPEKSFIQSFRYRVMKRFWRMRNRSFLASQRRGR